MKVTGIVFLVLISLCSFLHYPLSILYPIGAKDSVQMVFTYEFPHVFLASVLSLVYAGLNFKDFHFKSIQLKLVCGAVALILLSTAIYSVPFYRAIESMAFFTVPVAVFLAVRHVGSANVLYYMVSLVFLLNFTYCFIFSNSIGIAGNPNWLAATLICSFPFFLIAVRKVSEKAFYPILTIFSVLVIYIFIKTSARALIPAVLIFVFYFSVQRKSLKFNTLVFGSLGLLVLVAITLKSDRVSRVIQQDIRGPVTVDALRLVVSSPLLGTGPGNFQKDFPPYASEKLKKRIYYSSIVEHPHNELLNIMSGCGLPVAVLWLWFVYSLLGRKTDFESIALQFGLITTFVMGMADKPLTESPSAIIFLILCGLLIQDKFLEKEDRNPKALKLAGLSLALACLVFGVMRIQTDVKSRYHFWKAENLQSSMNSFNQRQIVPEMFRHYKASSEIDPYFINAIYSATAISIHFYDSLSQDQRLLEKMTALEPNYSDINKWIGLYYMKQARLLGEGQEKRATEAEAEKYYLQNFDLSPWNINRCRELIRFYVRTGNDEKVEEWILKAADIAKERLRTRFTHTDRTDVQEGLQHWVGEVLAQRKQPFRILDGMKANESGDYTSFEIFQRTNNLRAYATRANEKLDQNFWLRRLQLIKEMNAMGIKSVKDILKLLTAFEVDSSGIKWPLNTLKDKKGSVRSISSLACTMNNLLGNSATLLVNEEGLILCTLFEGEKSWIWNCANGKLLEASVDDFHNNSDLRESISGNSEDNFHYELFCYPESFCLRNQLISNLVSMHPDIPEFSLSPTLQKIELLKKNGAREIRYANKHIGLLDAAAMKK